MEKLKNTNEEIEKCKWKNWKTTNEEITNPQIKRLQNLAINEKFEKPQMKKLKNHKWKL